MSSLFVSLFDDLSVGLSRGRELKYFYPVLFCFDAFVGLSRGRELKYFCMLL